MTIWPFHFETLAKQSIMAESMWKGRTAYFMAARKQTERGGMRREEGTEDNTPFKGISPVTYFLKLSPIS